MLRKSFLCFSLVLATAAGVSAQQAEPATGAPRTDRDMNRLKELVDAGAAPRNVLNRAMLEVEDQTDDLILRRTLYGTIRPDEITEEQAVEMVGAAERRFKRTQMRIEQMKPLVEEGIIARLELTPHIEELDFRRRTLDLARSRAEFLKRLAEMAKAEQELETQREEEAAYTGTRPLVERFDGKGTVSRLEYKKVLLAWEKQFAKPLPVSADGDTHFHRTLGFDHRGRVDIALSPDEPEGRALIDMLQKDNIPFYAIRGAVPGKASGAHIHIGPPSQRLRVAD